MNGLHLHKTIESETLHLPELQAFMGQTVEIIVRELPASWLPGFWEAIHEGWQGEMLVRPSQGKNETRDVLR